MLVTIHSTLELDVSSQRSCLVTSPRFPVPPQGILVNEILNYIESPEKSTVAHGVGLAVALFCTEFLKAFFISLMWAVNLRTAARLKGAFSCMAFQKVISLRVHSGISMGEVKHDAITRRCSHFGGFEIRSLSLPSDD